MSNPSPQSSPPNGSPTLPVTAPAPNDPTPSLENTIEHYIGDFGWKQFYQTTIISLAMFFDAYNTFLTIFTDATPKWSFKNPTTTADNSTTDLCHLSPDLWSWDLPAHTSTISEWSLQCASLLVRGLPASAFFVGTIVGALVMATLADPSLGRKNLLVICSMIMSVTATLTAVSMNVWMYSGLRLLSGFGRGPIVVCSIVLASELCGRKWRDRVGICGYVCFASGFSSVPIAAYLLRGHSWRLLYLTAGIPCTVYSILVHFTVHESPRWLFIRGKRREFVKTLKSLSSRTEFSVNVLENYQGGLDQDQDIAPVSTSSLKELVKKKWALRRLVIVTLVAVGIGMTYYGMPLGLGNLSFNLYVSTMLNAIVEIPASAVAFFVIGRLRRKGSMFGVCCLSGVCALASVWVKHKGVQLGFELVAFFGGVMALDVVMIYSLELFPTCVRNTAVMGPRIGLVIGGAISPVLVAAAANKGYEWVSYAAFGTAILGSGVCVAGLPETRGSAWSDTMDEEETKME